MVELRLKGAPLAKNEFIRSEDIAHILKTIKELKVLELPYCCSNLFGLIEHPKRL
jgi:hypothetical protein